MIQVRYNTNYGKLPDQKRWRVLHNGVQLFTDSVTICTKSWTTKDIIEDENKLVEKWHVTCNPMIFMESIEAVYLKDDFSEPEESIEPLVCISWSMKNRKWKVFIKGEDRLFDDIVFETKLWTSDFTPELCCRPKHIGIVEQSEKLTLYLTDTI